jgi:predicted signal transduction protein with EAL and GGDEF domain
MSLVKRFPILTTLVVVLVLDAVVWFGADLIPVTEPFLAFGVPFATVGLAVAVVGWVYVRRLDLALGIAFGALVGTFAAMSAVVFVLMAVGPPMAP